MPVKLEDSCWTLLGNPRIVRSKDSGQGRYMVKAKCCCGTIRETRINVSENKLSYSCGCNGSKYEDLIRCCACKAWLYADHFGAYKKSKNSLKSTCKKCIFEQATRSKYGIDIDGIIALLIKQDYRCGICKRKDDDPAMAGKPNQIDTKLHIDHCHKTGKVRGLLCCGCNTFLGKIEKFRDILPEFLKYLDEANNG